MSLLAVPALTDNLIWLLADGGGNAICVDPGEAAPARDALARTGWRLRAVAEPYIVCTHAQTPEAILAPKQLCAEALQPCHALGQALAEGLALGVF